MLVRLLYASRATDPGCAAIEEILQQSRTMNPTLGITGILCYGGGVFLQALVPLLGGLRDVVFLQSFEFVGRKRQGRRGTL